MTREKAIAAALQTRKGYWTNIALWISGGALVAFALANVQVPRSDVWGLYLQSLLCVLLVLQSAERLAFPVRTALRSRALNIKFGCQISAISIYLVRAMFVAAICAVAYHLATRHGHTFVSYNALTTSGFLLSLLTYDLLGHKFDDSADHFEHSPPLTGLKPLQSEHWDTSHTS